MPVRLPRRCCAYSLHRKRLLPFLPTLAVSYKVDNIAALMERRYRNLQARTLALPRTNCHDLLLKLMSTRVALIFASFVSLSISFAQEEPPPAAAGSPSAASPASTTP